MIKRFLYTSASGIKERDVFVIKENDKYICGLDLKLLPEEDADTIKKIYKNVKPVTNFSEKVSLDNYNPSWNRAYRQFSKSRIQEL